VAEHSDKSGNVAKKEWPQKGTKGRKKEREDIMAYGKYRRGIITSPALGGMVKITIKGKDNVDHRTGDTDMWCKQPVILKQEGSLNCDLCSGDLAAARAAIQNVDVSGTVEDVSYTGGVETITQRAFTLKNAVCEERGVDANNDGGESSGNLTIVGGQLQVM
jgi:hypothetical protein